MYVVCVFAIAYNLVAPTAFGLCEMSLEIDAGEANNAQGAASVATPSSTSTTSPLQLTPKRIHYSSMVPITAKLQVCSLNRFLFTSREAA